MQIIVKFSFPENSCNQVEGAVDAEGLGQCPLRDVQDGPGAPRVPGVPDLVAAVGDGLAQRRHLCRARGKGGGGGRGARAAAASPPMQEKGRAGR